MKEIYGYKEHRERLWKHVVSAPFIWLPLLPILLLDIVMELYHRVGFVLYKLPYKKRSEYIIFDRQRLDYLHWYDKVFCTYCAYANGVFLYWSAIAADTERYWCGIRHQKVRLKALKEEEKDFLKYGDEKAFEKIDES